MEYISSAVMKLDIFKSSNIAHMLSDPETRRLPSNLLCLIIYGLRGVWLRNIEPPSKSFLLKHLFRFSAFTLSVLPPPFVRQAKGIFS